MKNKVLLLIPILLVSALSSCFSFDSRYEENMEAARIERVIPSYENIQKGYNTNIVIHDDALIHQCRDIDSKYLSVLSKINYEEISERQVKAKTTKVYYGFGVGYRNIYLCLSESDANIVINYTKNGPLPPKPAIRYYKIAYESGLELYNTALEINDKYQDLITNGGGLEDFKQYFKAFSPLVTTKTSYRVTDTEYKVLNSIKEVNEYTLVEDDVDFSKTSPNVKYEMPINLPYQGIDWTFYLYSYIYIKLEFKYMVDRETFTRTYLYSINFTDGYRINDVATNL